VISNATRLLDPSNAWTWIVPLAGAAWLLALTLEVLPADAGIVRFASTLLLGGVVFAAVHHAEVIALRVGEPFGSVVLALSVTIIEVGLIVSIMLSATTGSETLARDTVYATVMIVLNGVVGICLVVGGARHREQTFRPDATATLLSVIGTLAVITIVLPNFTSAAAGPRYSQVQLLVVSLATIALQCVFLFVQTVRHREYFLVQAAGGTAETPSNRAAAASGLLLLAALACVVLLAKWLAPALEEAIGAARLPIALVGVAVAAVVLLPESISALRAARDNRLQTSLNLALGSATATIGLTVPIVGFVAIALDRPLVLGLGTEDMVLLVLTLFISTVTLATGRTTILQGAVHLVIFAVFVLLSFVP
jgi:Ca2+:H+ antiporter